MTLSTAMFGVATVALIATSNIASAHDYYHDECNIELSGNMKYENSVLTVTLDNGDQAEFTPQGDVYIDGQLLSLSATQSELAKQYYNNIQEAVPTTIEVAKEAVNIASTAVTEVFSELLGGDDELSQEFNAFFEEVNFELDNKFYAENGSFYVDTADFDNGHWFDQRWENEFEEKVESLVAKSIGKLLITLGTEMMFGDGDASAFESRMENFGESLEHRLTESSEVLEVKAEKLCGLLVNADDAENELANSVNELKKLNVFDVESRAQSM
jgi:hypothetical protein